MFVLGVGWAWLIAPDQCIVWLLQIILRLLRWLVKFGSAYLGIRVHHFLIFVNFRSFEIIKRQNFEWLFAGSMMADLLPVNVLLIISHVIEDTRDAHELKSGLYSWRIIVDWSLIINGTFILLKSWIKIRSFITGSPRLSGSSSSSLRLRILLLWEIADCLKSPKRTSRTDGCNCVLDNINPRAVDSIFGFGYILSLFYSSWSHTIWSLYITSCFLHL